jgi:RNA polymerase sigma factor (sigma-70 family)
MTATDPRRVVETVWRIESARIIATVTRIVGDVGIAEELAQDTMVIALEQWPRTGVPDDPGPWLMATAKHRAIDLVRRRVTYARKLAEIGRTLEETEEPEYDLDSDHVEDDVLRLMFIACHPVLPAEARSALTLRLLGGLSTDEIARAFLEPAPTVGQRISRAKKTLATNRIPFELPPSGQRAERLASVLEVIYLIFNEGYSATAGADWTRPNLCEEAMRLGRILAGLAPDDPEVHGLVALMELQASRLGARTDADGSPVLLPDQDRTRWDRLLIRRGLAALETARTIGGAVGPFVLQAEIAACHATAASTDATDWPRIAALYQVLTYIWPSPVAELNRAVAVGRAGDPAKGLSIVDDLRDSLADYPQLPVVRADLLERLGQHSQAATEYARAAAMTRNDRERELYQRKASAARAATGPGA